MACRFTGTGADVEGLLVETVEGTRATASIRHAMLLTFHPKQRRFMSDDAPDLFGHRPAQGDLFGAAAPAVARPQVDPQKVRLWLNAMLSDLRAAEGASPWPQETTRLNRVIFPQMSNWLPPEERDQLCFAFEAELKRLKLAA